MVYCTSDTLPLVEVRSGTKFTAPFGSAFTKCRRTSNGLKLQHTIKQACLGVGSGSFPFGKHRFLAAGRFCCGMGSFPFGEHRFLAAGRLCCGTGSFPFGKHRFLVDRKACGLVLLWRTSHF